MWEAKKPLSGTQRGALWSLQHRAASGERPLVEHPLFATVSWLPLALAFLEYFSQEVPWEWADGPVEGKEIIADSAVLFYFVFKKANLGFLSTC